MFRPLRAVRALCARARACLGRAGWGLARAAVRLATRLFPGTRVPARCCARCAPEQAARRTYPAYPYPGPGPGPGPSSHTVCRHFASRAGFAAATVQRPNRPCAGRLWLANRGGTSATGDRGPRTQDTGSQY